MDELSQSMQAKEEREEVGEYPGRNRERSNFLKCCTVIRIRVVIIVDTLYKFNCQIVYRCVPHLFLMRNITLQLQLDFSVRDSADFEHTHWTRSSVVFVSFRR